MLEKLLEESISLINILIAFVLGFVVGVERKSRNKEAGMRTHAIVAGGAALLTVVGKIGFPQSESARVAAQIVTGIGFLGSGIIMFRRDSLRGVTTAAGIWATAGVGMASGAGLYVVAVGTTIFILLLQWALHLRINMFSAKKYYIYRIKFNCSLEQNENEMVKKIFDVTTYSRINYYSNAGGISASAEISTARTVTDEEIKDIMFKNDFITAFERVYQLDGKE